MLITLAYRLPRDRARQVLGTVTAYPLTREFSDAWDKLPAGENGKQPRYSSLATGLCAATAQPVRLFGERDLAQGELDAGSRMLLLSSHPFDYRLPVAVTTWERCIRGDLPVPTLAPLLPLPEPARPLASYVTFRPGACPEAPNWVFRTAAWQLMSSLARTRLRIDGRQPLTLHMDTDGSLLAWETSDLITNPAGTAFGMARITARLVTSPGTGDLVVCFSAHLSRISGTWAKVKNTWIARDTPGAPLLRLPVRHRRRPNTDPLAETNPWRHLLSRGIPDIIEACELEPITLPDNLPPSPGSVRPQAPGNLRHSLGTGLGARFMLRLHEHITACLPDLEPLSLEPDKTITLAKRDPDPVLGDIAIGSTGYRHLTIACLYATSGARDRMLGALQSLIGQQLMSLPDGELHPVTDRIAVIAFHLPEMLAHGQVNRAAHLARLLASPGIKPESDDLTCAWIETEYHPDVPIDRAADAKPQLRRILAHRQIPSQFLATEPLQLPKGARPRTEAARSHAARSALHDLLRIAGILDDRIPQAVTGSKLRHPLDRPALLVGIHARRQQTGNDDDKPLVLVLTAIRATPDPDVPWQALMYSEKQHGWLRHAAGVADFHSGKIGDPMLGRTEEKAARTRNRVDKRLVQLAADHPDLPLVIFTDGPSTRTIWPGLQDRHFGTGTMPGDTLCAAGHDVAVVRSNHSGEIGRPVTRHGEGTTPADPLQPAAPGRRVYQRTDTRQPVWLFAGISRTYGAKGGAIGAQYTRWTLPDGLSGKLRKPWHSYTATEIAVPYAGIWDPAALAALTARLSEQPISWDGRVVYATPLHLAVTADKDHPDYRVATPQEADDEADKLGLADEEAENLWADEPDQEDTADADTDLQESAHNPRVRGTVRPSRKFV
jgi:RNaseH domain of pPIWI_RE/pPIWI_RE module N-terminal domain/MID domain of pPIWI_RE